MGSNTKIMATDSDGSDFSEKYLNETLHMEMNIDGGDLYIFLTDDVGAPIAKASIPCKDIFANAVTKKLGVTK